MFKKGSWIVLSWFAILALALTSCSPAVSTAAASEPTTAPAATSAPAQPTGAPAQPTSAPAATSAPTEMPAAPTTAPTTMPTPTYTANSAAESAAMAAAGGKKIGGSVDFVGPWGGAEQNAFVSVVQPFEAATGITVNYTGSRDVNSLLVTRVTAGNPPDLADFSTPGLLSQFQSQGKLQDLSKVLDMNTMNQDYAKTWIDLGTYNGEFVAVMFKVATKGLIWYDPKVFQADNLKVPTTWDEMIALSKQLESQGKTPWCVALNSGSASGWPGTDWLEDIVLRQAGQAAYNQWWQGKLAWTSPEITKAWQTWGQIVADQKMLYGGANRTLSTNFANDADPLFTSPPGCYMEHQASFMSGFIQTDNPSLKAGTDYNFFPVPPFTAGSPSSVEIGGDLIGAFTNTPQAQALVRYLATPEAQDIWAKIGGGYLSANLKVPSTDYPDVLSQKSAQLLSAAKVAVFDASDQMPSQMTNAFYQAVLNYIQNPADLNSILQNLDNTQKSAYTQ
jgi:alpha-glucoside transport system substrate-binding protein